MSQTADDIKQKTISQLDKLSSKLSALSQQGWDDFMFSRLFPKRTTEVSRQAWEEYEDLEDSDYLKQIGTSYWCNREVVEFGHLAEDLQGLKASHWWPEIIKALPSAAKLVADIIRSFQALDNYAKTSAKMSAITGDPQWSMLSTELSDSHPELGGIFLIDELRTMSEVYSGLKAAIQTI